MSNLCFGLFGIIKLRPSNCSGRELVRFFSSRSNNSNNGHYKVVKRKSVPKSGELWRDTNYELLAPSSGFPFILPGNVGPAWYDKYSTANNEELFIMEQIPNESDANILCRVQTCPTVLRKSVLELFPNRNLEHAELSVVTLSLKPDVKQMRVNQEVETEKMAQTFVLTANNICQKLRKAGYWSDFINPFSGKPYLYPAPRKNTSLYETDEKFRCLDFQIIEIKDCKIVTNEIATDNLNKKRFVGSLFTNAPSQKTHLNSIFANGLDK